MKKRQLVSWFAALAVGTAIVVPGAAAEESPTFLWRVSSPTSNLYLLGSIHAMKEESYPLPSAMESAYDAVNTLIFEVNFDELNGAALKMLQAGMLDGDRTLEQVVGPQIWADFTKVLEARNFSPATFQKMRPWAAALNLTVFELMRAGYLPTKGIDTYFSERAGKDGKGRAALETAEFQVGLFANLTPAQSLAFLEYTLVDLEHMVDELDDLAENWRAGEVAQIEKLLLDGFEEFPAVFQKMVSDRNRNWMLPLEMQLAGTDDALVVIGAMHLVGEVGLLAEFRRLGYRVEQL